MAGKKGETMIPRDYQDRIVKFIEQMGDDAFTAQECATGADVPVINVRRSLYDRSERDELARVLVGNTCLYQRKDDAKVGKEQPGLVAELIWATLKDAGSEEDHVQGNRPENRGAEARAADHEEECCVGFVQVASRGLHASDGGLRPAPLSPHGRSTRSSWAAGTLASGVTMCGVGSGTALVVRNSAPR